MGPDGKVNKNDKIEFNEFIFQTEVGFVDNDGFFNPPADPLIHFDKSYTINVAFKQNPALGSSIVLDPDYSCVKYSDSRGKEGITGVSGCSGMDGLQGTSYYGGTLSGCPGGFGSPGYKGGCGGNGDEGPNIEVNDYLY